MVMLMWSKIMSHSSVPNSPEQPQPVDNSVDVDSRRNQDEWIAVLVALLAMGGIFFWVFGKNDRLGGFNLARSSSSTATQTFPSVSQFLDNPLSTDGSVAFSPSTESPSTSTTSSSSGFQPYSSPRTNRGRRVVNSGAFFPWGQPTQTTTETPTTEEETETPAAVETPTETEETPAATPEAQPTSEATETPTETSSDGSPEGKEPPETPALTEGTVPEEADSETTEKPETPEEETAEATDSAETDEAATAEKSETPEEETAEATDSTDKPRFGLPIPGFGSKPSETDSTAASGSGFSDVPEDYWAKDYIEYFTERKIVAGYEDGSFKPDEPVTRAAVAGQIENAFEFDPNDQNNALEFQDVDSEYWAESAINSTTKTGFLNGYPGEVFRPDQSMTRTEVIVALVSGLDLKPSANPEETLKVYQDADQIPEWAIEKIAAATEAGIVVSHPNTDQFNPSEPATRAEVSALIYQALTQAGKVDPQESEYIVNPKK